MRASSRTCRPKASSRWSTYCQIGCGRGRAGRCVDPASIAVVVIVDDDALILLLVDLSQYWIKSWLRVCRRSILVYDTGGTRDEDEATIQQHPGANQGPRDAYAGLCFRCTSTTQQKNQITLQGHCLIKFENRAPAKPQALKDAWARRAIARLLASRFTDLGRSNRSAPTNHVRVTTSRGATGANGHVVIHGHIMEYG